jgi:hypothetical protein
MPNASYVWDYPLTGEQFEAILRGDLHHERFSQAWAAVRVLEYAPYAEIRRLIGFPLLIAKWADWRSGVRSRQRREALDFLIVWLPANHPELFN